MVGCMIVLINHDELFVCACNKSYKITRVDAGLDDDHFLEVRVV